MIWQTNNLAYRISLSVGSMRFSNWRPKKVKHPSLLVSLTCKFVNVLLPRLLMLQTATLSLKKPSTGVLNVTSLLYVKFMIW